MGFSLLIGTTTVYRADLLGFKAVVQVTTEETKKRFRELFGKGGEF